MSDAQRNNKRPLNLPSDDYDRVYPGVKKQEQARTEPRFNKRSKILDTPAQPTFTPVIKKTKQRRNIARKQMFIAAGFLLAALLGLGGYFIIYAEKDTKEPVQLFAVKEGSQLTIPVYFPKNLPPGYTYNKDASTIKKNVYYFTVTAPKDIKLYITQQPIPEQFDFVSFNKKFLTPDKFDSSAGSVVAGQVGSSFIGSIVTKKNTWILINSTSPNTLNQVEAVARSLEL